LAGTKHTYVRLAIIIHCKVEQVAKNSCKDAMEEEKMLPSKLVQKQMHKVVLISPALTIWVGKNGERAIIHQQVILQSWV